MQSPNCSEPAVNSSVFSSNFPNWSGSVIVNKDKAVAD